MQFNCVRKIGKGGFGHVLLATKATSSSTFYAIKCLSKKKMIKDPLLKKSLIQEINTMASLDHPNIVKLYKTFEGNSTLIQRETGTFSCSSTAIWEIFTLFRVSLPIRCSPMRRQSTFLTRYWEELNASTKTKSFIATSNFKIFSSKNQIRIQPMFVKLETLA